jgi:hypothetical protein
VPVFVSGIVSVSSALFIHKEKFQLTVTKVREKLPNWHYNGQKPVVE